MVGGEEILTSRDANKNYKLESLHSYKNSEKFTTYNLISFFKVNNKF